MANKLFWKFRVFLGNNQEGNEAAVLTMSGPRRWTFSAVRFFSFRSAFFWRLGALVGDISSPVRCEEGLVGFSQRRKGAKKGGAK